MCQYCPCFGRGEVAHQSRTSMLMYVLRTRGQFTTRTLPTLPHHHSKSPSIRLDLWFAAIASSASKIRLDHAVLSLNRHEWKHADLRFSIADSSGIRRVPQQKLLHVDARPLSRSRTHCGATELLGGMRPRLQVRDTKAPADERISQP